MTIRTIVLLYLLPQQVRMLKTGRAGDDDKVAAAATGLDKSSLLGKEPGRVGSWGAHRVSTVGPNGPIGKTWAFFRPGQVRTGLGRAEKTRLFRVEKILPMPGLGQVTCACPSHSAHLIFFSGCKICAHTYLVRFVGGSKNVHTGAQAVRLGNGNLWIPKSPSQLVFSERFTTHYLSGLPH
jgi:hypothetical protein